MTMHKLMVGTEDAGAVTSQLDDKTIAFGVCSDGEAHTAHVSLTIEQAREIAKNLITQANVLMMKEAEKMGIPFEDFIDEEQQRQLNEQRDPDED